MSRPAAFGQQSLGAKKAIFQKNIFKYIGLCILGSRGRERALFLVVAGFNRPAAFGYHSWVRENGSWGKKRAT